MSAEDPLLDRTLIEDAFRRLGDRLVKRGVVGDLYIFGGAAMALAHVAPGGDAAAPRVFDHPGLRVSAASPEHLLAMKVLAARRRDAEDIRFLVAHLHLTTADEVLALCAEIFVDEEVPPRARLVLEDVFGER